MNELYSIINNNTQIPPLLDTKLEGVQETLENKIKILITNMDHEIDEVRDNINIESL